MPPRNGNKSSRSKGRGRGCRKEPQETASEALSLSSQGHDTLSPTNNDGLPPSNQNKATEGTVSISSPIQVSIEANKATASKTTPSINDNDVEKRGSKVLVDNTLQTNDVGASGKVSDNTALPSETITTPSPSPHLWCDDINSNQQDPLASNPDDPWDFTFSELRTMRSRMLTLEKLDLTTKDISKQLEITKGKTSTIETKLQQNTQQLKEVSHNTSKLESRVDNNFQQLKDMQKEIADLKKTVEDQQQIISNLTQIKKDFKKDKEDFAKKSRNAVTEMNKLVDAQREQVESFKSIRDDFKQKSEDQGKQISKISHDLDHKSLKDKAFRYSFNLVIRGLAEDNTHSAYSLATKFFKNDLKLKKLDVDAAYRLGKPPPENSTYSRPIVVRFARLSDRNAVWKKREEIPQSDEQQHIKIQAHMPTQLRQDVAILYKVAKAASLTTEYKSAHVRDYALVFNGKEYTARQLEHLPRPLRPSSLAIKRTDTVLVFFSKFCELSNHFQSPFQMEEKVFHNVEHYLAFKKAELSGKDYFIQKALDLSDPVEAKSILHSLRKDHEQDWERNKQNFATMGIRAKFTQNKVLSSYLQNTGNLILGEASKDPCWGVGMTLEHQQVTEPQKWDSNGNLLGRILMQIRDEMVQPKGGAN